MVRWPAVWGSERASCFNKTHSASSFLEDALLPPPLLSPCSPSDIHKHLLFLSPLNNGEGFICPPIYSVCFLSTNSHRASSLSIHSSHRHSPFLLLLFLSSSLPTCLPSLLPPSLYYFPTPFPPHRPTPHGRLTSKSGANTW